MALLDFVSPLLESFMDVVVDGTAKSLKDLKKAIWVSVLEFALVASAVAAIAVGVLILLLLHLPLEVFALLCVVGGLVVLVASLLLMLFK